MKIVIGMDMGFGYVSFIGIVNRLSSKEERRFTKPRHDLRYVADAETDRPKL